MTVARGDAEPGVGALVRDLADGGRHLVRQEIRLARLELAEVARRAGSGAIQVASGGIVAILGVIAFVTGIILLIGEEGLRGRYWLAALIVTVVLGLVAAVMARRGATLVSPERLEPDETMATLKEDTAWLKRQLTSGATSS
jgi:hypothetical protein